MNKLLSKKTFYLSAPIEFGTDNWRYEFKDNIIKKFDLNIYDPFLDPKQQWKEQITEARKEKDYDRIASIARKFYLKDCLMVDKSDGLIAYLPYGVATHGVPCEILQSIKANKPTYIVCPEGKELVPVWYYGMLSHNNMFGSLEDLIDYFEKIDNAKVDDEFLWSIYGII